MQEGTPIPKVFEAQTYDKLKSQVVEAFPLNTNLTVRILGFTQDGRPHSLEVLSESQDPKLAWEQTTNLALERNDHDIILAIPALNQETAERELIIIRTSVSAFFERALEQQR